MLKGIIMTKKPKLNGQIYKKNQLHCITHVDSVTMTELILIINYYNNNYYIIIIIMSIHCSMHACFAINHEFFSLHAHRLVKRALSLLVCKFCNNFLSLSLL